MIVLNCIEEVDAGHTGQKTGCHGTNMNIVYHIFTAFKVNCTYFIILLEIFFTLLLMYTVSFRFKFSLWWLMIYFIIKNNMNIRF